MRSFKKLATLLILSCSISTVSAQAFLNLDFESISNNKPRLWTASNNAAIYTLDSIEKFSGNYSYKISKTDPSEQRDAFFRTTLPLHLVQGKEIIIKGKIKTNIQDKANAGLYLIVSDKNNKPIHFDDMKGKRIDRTSSWQEVTITAKIDSNATQVYFGGICSGTPLTAWYDNLELFIDGQKYTEPTPRTAPLTKKELDVLKKYCYPLRSFDPNFKTDTDLSILKKLTKDVQVVSLGEVSHGSSEIFKMKHRIIKYLAQHDKFNLLASETNMPESAEIHKAIMNQQFDQINLHEKLQLWPWHMREIRDLFNWMQNYNQGKPKIEFAGFDMQFYQGAIRTLKAFCIDDPKIQKDVYEFENLVSAIAQQSFQQKGIMTLSAEQTQLTNQYMAQFKTAIEKSNRIDKDYLLQNIRVLEQYLTPHADRAQYEEKRDRYMAENLLWLKKHHPNSKIITWAHNGHVSKNDSNIGFFNNPKKMGAYIVDAIADQSIVFGFAFYDGSFTAVGPKGLTSYAAETAFPGSYEYFLNQVDEPIFILDLKKVKAEKPAELDWLLTPLSFRIAGANKMNNDFDYVNIAKDFDYIIFIKTSTSSEFLN